MKKEIFHTSNYKEYKNGTTSVDWGVLDWEALSGRRAASTTCPDLTCASLNDCLGRVSIRGSSSFETARPSWRLELSTPFRKLVALQNDLLLFGGMMFLDK